MKCYWYHIRQERPEWLGYRYWGNSVTIHPVNDGYYRSPDEPTTARFCVAPTIAQCIAALGMGCLMNKEIEVYRTEVIHEVGDGLIPAEEVIDSYITDEHWFVKPVKMVLHKMIPFHRNYGSAPDAGISTIHSNWPKFLIKQGKYLTTILEKDAVLQCN